MVVVPRAILLRGGRRGSTVIVDPEGLVGHR
jgi:hypothetical protein